MKTILLVAIVITFSLLITGFQCRKDEPRLTSGCLKGELIDALCGNIIIKIKSGNYDPRLVNASWQDPQTGNTYTNVFAVANSCEWLPTITAGQEFSFFFVEDHSQNCNLCTAFRATPSQHNSIRVVTSCQ